MTNVTMADDFYLLLHVEWAAFVQRVTQCFVARNWPHFKIRSLLVIENLAMPRSPSSRKW